MSTNVARLVKIEEDSPNFRGQCTACGRKSYRWASWWHVRKWYEKHKCVQVSLDRM